MEGSPTHSATQSGNRVLLALVLAVASMALVVLVSSPADATRPRVERASVTGISRGLAPSLAGSGGPVRVTLFLTDNSVLPAASRHADALTRPLPGGTAARRLALRGTRRGVRAERLIAARMDEMRNTALSAIRRESRPAIAQNERVAAQVKRLGGRVVSSTPLPNALTVVIDGKRLTQLARWAEVYAVRKAPPPITWMSSPIDGSETWHSNGFTGGTPNPGNVSPDGPDYVALDQGVRVSHRDFKTRLPGDSATGPGTGSTRVISPVGRTTFGGSSHGNNIAAIVVDTDLTSIPSGAPPPAPANWTYYKGLAYGLDKLYDPNEAKNEYAWMIGLTSNGEPGVTDLPEVINFSAGAISDNIDYHPSWLYFDAATDQLGITATIAAGNCGVAGENGCITIHRVETPGNSYNSITLGGLTTTDPYDSSTWTVWANSSPGPTYGGRKKPDLIASPTAGACPVTYNDTDHDNCGSGTSFAAPQAAAGAILLASAGVYSPMAQKSILINTATPIQGQTYWMPRSGWGTLNLDGAYYNRANYAQASITPAGDNGTRFFRQTGVASGDRTTLVWNRRTIGGPMTATTYQTLTNLDLFQIDPGAGTTTGTDGVDANDAVDTDQTVSVDNPMPGNGTDGGDNVEQVRSTGTGTQIYKVKAQSSIAGAANEPFALAGAHVIEALSTPIPSVSLVRSGPVVVAPGQSVTVTATTTNPSGDLALSGASVTLSVPAGVTITSGPASQSIGTLATSGTSIKSWTMTGSTDGLQNLTARTNGTAYSEPFAGNGSASFTVDATPPTVSIDQKPAWSPTATPTFAWTATDALSSVDHYDVELARNGGTFTPLLTSTTTTTASVTGSEGEQLSVRVRAADDKGNVSGWTEQTVTVDVAGPTVTIGNATEAADGTITAEVSASNVGSPVTVSYVFGIPGSRAVNADAATGPTVRYTFTRQHATTYPVLTVTATDSLGRAATATRTFTVAGSIRSPNLRFTSARQRGSYVVLSGKLDAAANGRVRITATRIGKSGVRHAKKTLKIRSGRFSGRLRLAPGRYRVKASFAGSSAFSASSASMRFRVR